MPSNYVKERGEASLWQAIALSNVKVALHPSLVASTDNYKPFQGTSLVDFSCYSNTL